MRTRLIFTAAATLLVLACAGIRARTDVLLPAMAQAWPDIASDAEVGIQVAISRSQLTAPEAAWIRRQAEDMGRGLEARDRSQVLAVDWPPIRAHAELGITARVGGDAVGPGAEPIGPGVAESLREQLRNFDEALRKLGER